MNLNELEEKAFQILPHTRIYGDQRHVIGWIDWSATDKPEIPFYEEFMEKLDLYYELEDEKEIRSLTRELERIENWKRLEQLIEPVSFARDVDYVIDKIAPRQGTVLITGLPKSGKTLFGLQMCGCVEEGKPFLCFKTQRGKALFIEVDEPRPSFKKKLMKMIKVYPALLDLPRNKMKLQWDSPEFEEVLNLYRPDLVVIDTFAKFGIEDVNEAKYVTPAMSELQELAERHDCCVVILHHQPWGVERPKGSVDLAAGVYGYFGLTRKGKGTMFRVGGMREQEFDEMKLSRNEETLTFAIQMIDRARQLSSQGTDPSEGIKILMDEYHVSRANARTTWNNASKPLKAKRTQPKSK
jgi:hypothetical protein